MSSAANEPATLRDRLRHALPAAMKARDTTAVAALRSALAAIDNAEAVDASFAPTVDLAGEIANSAVGLGAGDVQRRTLSEAQVAGVVRAEITDRRAAAAEYERAEQHDRAVRLRGEADVLDSHVVGGA